MVTVTADEVPPHPGAADPAGDQLVLERAKGALMLRYGIDSCQALGVLAAWARGSGEPLAVVAHTLVHGICEGSPRTATRQRQLVARLEDQLRHHDLDSARGASSPGVPADR